MTDQPKSTELLDLTADIVSSHVANNTVAVTDVPQLIESVYRALSSLEKEEEPVEEAQKPAVSVRQSVKPDYLICLEDGKKLKMLKRYLMTNFGMTPDDYRKKWGLPADYPMVAPSYSEKRRRLAKKIGLGTRRQTAKA